MLPVWFFSPHSTHSQLVQNRQNRPVTQSKIGLQQQPFLNQIKIVNEGVVFLEQDYTIRMKMCYRGCHELEQCNGYSDQDMDWMVWGLNPGRAKKFFSSPKRPDQLWSPPTLQFNVYCGSFIRIKQPGRELTSMQW